MIGRVTKEHVMAKNKENQCSPNCWCKKEKSDEYLYA
jgi:hypothetical protein